MEPSAKRFRTEARRSRIPNSGAAASFPAPVRLQWLQLLLVAPHELDVGNVDHVAGLNTQSPELVGDSTRFEKSLKPLHAFVSREISHARKAFYTDSGHDKMMARQAVRVPCPFVDVFERVSPPLLRLFDLSLLLLDLAKEGSHRLEHSQDAFAGYRRDRKCRV